MKYLPMLSSGNDLIVGKTLEILMVSVPPLLPTVDVKDVTSFVICETEVGVWLHIVVGVLVRDGFSLVIAVVIKSLT